MLLPTQAESHLELSWLQAYEGAWRRLWLAGAHLTAETTPTPTVVPSASGDGRVNGLDARMASASTAGIGCAAALSRLDGRPPIGRSVESVTWASANFGPGLLGVPRPWDDPLAGSGRLAVVIRTRGVWSQRCLQSRATAALIDRDVQLQTFLLSNSFLF
jgi:hypothetical protein